MALQIIVKDYSHFNSAMDKHITSKAHYKNEMAKGGYVDYERGQEMAEKAQRAQRKDYKPTKKMLDIINTARLKADKKGKVRLDDRMIEAINNKGGNK